MKHYIIFLFLLLAAYGSFAQSGVLWDRYYISGSLSLGQAGRQFADSAAWLQLGKDTTAKGILFPRVLLDSIHTTKRALFVYDLKDSVLYHFDGTRRVRYMTYKDSAAIRQLFSIYRTTDSIAEGSNNLYYTTARARSAVSAGAGIGYNNTTGVITNTGVLTVDGNAGNIDLAATYHKQGGNAINATSVIGNTGNFGINFITNNTTKFGISNAGRGLFSGSTAEDILTLSNDKTSKLIMGVGRNGAFSSDNFPFILFGSNSSVDPIITTSGSRLDINRVDALMLSSNPLGNTPEIRGTMFGAMAGSVLGIGSRANAAGSGHTGTSGSLNWLTIPWHYGVNSDIIPASGNMEFNIINIIPRVNQSGTASGTVRGIYINPNLISAPDFRAVVLANVAGYGIYQASSVVKNWFNGPVGIGGDAGADKLTVTGTVRVSAGTGTFSIASTGKTTTTAGNVEPVAEFGNTQARKLMVFNGQGASVSTGVVGLAFTPSSVFTPGSAADNQGASISYNGFNLSVVAPYLVVQNGWYQGQVSQSGITTQGSAYVRLGTNHAILTHTSGMVSSVYANFNGHDSYGFKPTSGTGEFNCMLVDGQIDQSAGGTGITRGLYISPRILVNPANWRAIDIPVTSSAKLLTGIYQSGTWSSNGGSPVGSINTLAGRNVFGNIHSAAGMIGSKFEYMGVNMAVGADEGVAGGGNLYEANTRTNNNNKAFILRAITYGNTDMGAIAATSTASSNDLYVGVGSSYGTIAPDRTTFFNTVSGASTRTLSVFNTGNINIGSSTSDPGYKLQVQGTTKVDGAFETTATLTTAQPSANGAGIIKIGKVITGATVTVQTDRYLEVEVDGVIRKLAIVD